MHALCVVLSAQAPEAAALYMAAEPAYSGAAQMVLASIDEPFPVKKEYQAGELPGSDTKMEHAPLLLQ